MTNNEIKVGVKPRKIWLDALRGLAMIFVVLVHASSGLSHWDKYNVIIGPIMLPLFFAISGYLFKINDGNVLSFIKKITLNLIVPWFILSLVWLYAF